MAPMTNMVKVSKYFQGPSIETSNFAFEDEVIQGLKRTHLECRDRQLDIRTARQTGCHETEPRQIEHSSFFLLDNN